MFEPDGVSGPDPVGDLACRRCGRSVRIGRANFEMFEGMHFVCFHYEFEHVRPIRTTTVVRRVVRRLRPCGIRID